MSTPAQLLAMKHAEADEAEASAQTPAPVSSAGSAESTESKSSATTTTPASPVSSAPSSAAESEATVAAASAAASAASAPAKKPAQKKKKRVIAMDDDVAFPSLGASVHSAPPVSWRPAANGASTANGAKVSGGYAQAANTKAPGSAKNKFRPAVKSSNTQLIFVVDADQQVELPKAEMFKLFSRFKRQYDVSIESTLSAATNKRTYLLSGPTATIQEAKRDLLKNLTKPVKLQFGVPAALRATIIGAKGRTLKPILEATKTKIDIERDADTPTPAESRDADNASDNADDDDDDDVFGKMVSVVVEGDAASCEEAKAQILAIVNEHTKTLDARIKVNRDLIPFLPVAVGKLSLPADVEVIYPDQNSIVSNVLLAGPRESVLQARDQIRQLLALLSREIVAEEQAVPKRVHSLLDVAKIFENTNVLVKVPPESSDVQTVQFVGIKEQIPSAVAYARELCSNFFVDSLDLGRSHGGNAPHSKCLTAYFLYTKFFKELSTKYGVQIHAPSYASLANDDVSTAIVTFTCTKDHKDVLKQVRKELVDAVNKITPNLVRVVKGIDAFVMNRLDTTVAVEKGVSVVPLGLLAGFGSKIVLILQQNEDEFLPSGQEIQQKLDSVDQSLDPLRKLSEDVESNVVAVPAKDQDHLQGKTLEVLLGKFDADSIEIKLHQNAEGPSPDEIFLSGFKKDIAAAIDDISQAIDDVKNYEEACKYHDSVEFPRALLSRLIGRSGAHMNQLRDQFDVKIDVEGEDKADSESAATVVVTGLKGNVDECIKSITQLGKRWADERTVVLKIDPQYHRRLIGPGGVYVNKLQDRYNVSVRFPHENDKNGHKDEVVIRGPSRGVTKTEAELKELLAYEQENGFKEVVSVPAAVLSRVIGKNGEHIKDISADAGVSINNLREKGDAGEAAQLEIVGSRTAIQKAKKSIEDIVSKVENYTTETVPVDPKWHRLLIGPGGSSKRQIILKAGGSDENSFEFRKYLQVPNRGSGSQDVVCAGDKKIVDKIVAEVKRIVAEQESVTTETITVPKKQHRRLIGPGGMTRRSLEDEFKIRLIVPRVNDESDEVKLRGQPDDIVKAKAKIETLVQ